MDRRFLLFLLLASLALLGNALVMSWLNRDQPKPPGKPPAVAQGDQPPLPAGQHPDGTNPDGQPSGNPPVQNPDNKTPEPPVKPENPAVDPAVPGNKQPMNEPAPAAADPQRDLPERLITLGSLSTSASDGPQYRMLVTLSSSGAAVKRLEMSDPRLGDLEDSSGYLGHLAAEDNTDPPGARLRVVGPGTPAAIAGLKAEDVITALGDRPIRRAIDLQSALAATNRKQTVRIEFSRAGQPAPAVEAVLGRRPLEVVRPEGLDPLSFLLTLQQIGSRELNRETGIVPGQSPDGKDGVYLAEVQAGSLAAEAGLKAGDLVVSLDDMAVDDMAEMNEILFSQPQGTRLLWHVERGDQTLKIPLALPSELSGLNLRRGNWEVVSADDRQVVFRWQLPAERLEIIKRYELPPIDAKNAGRDYHLQLSVEIKNTGADEQLVAYQLDGPNGLPIEGWWYSNKIARGWNAVGVRDVVVKFSGQTPEIVAPIGLTGTERFPRWTDTNWLDFLAVDAQYVASALVPVRSTSEVKSWIAEAQPLRVGPVPEEKPRRKLTNTSCRLISRAVSIAPGEPLVHRYEVFAGPKRPELLARYGLGDLVYYGWFGWVAVPMLHILHFFYSLVHNYGIAIIMLTVLVRGCMFPLSRKQAVSAQKMQELQPELKKLAEKYKSNLEQRNKAQQELFRKHNYNPLGGCLLMFVQLPIFIGLYRSLMVDVELRQAPLIPGLEWCSNLAAPDMLFRWSGWLPQFLSSETGYLGPYFNLLPLFTIGLFLWQQKLFMPPPADEQAAMQQQIMKFMMIFMGFMFFKVASGLCIYFIASSLWGIAERKLLPKSLPAAGKTAQAPDARSPASGSNGSNGSAGSGDRRKKQQGGKS